MDPLDNDTTLDSDAALDAPPMGVFPEDDSIADGEAVGDEPPRRARGGRRARPAADDPDSRHPPRKTSTGELQQLEFDEWAAAFQWDRPRMKMILKRIAPQYYLGVRTAGHLEDKQQSPFSLDEIKARYGGGEYEAIVAGPRDERDHFVRTISRKRFTIVGNPITSDDVMPDELRDKMQQNFGRGATAPRAGAVADPATKGLLDIVSAENTALREQVYGRRPDASMEQMRATYTEAMNTVKESAEQRATAREQAAAERAAVAQEWANRERAEREALQARVLEMERETLKKQEEMREQINERLRSSQGDSFQLLGALLPTFSQSSSEQVRIISSQFEAREERLAAQHQTQLQQLSQIHQIQLQSQQTAFEAQMRNLEASRDNAITLLKGQLQNLQNEKDLLLRQLDETRRNLEDSRKDLMTHITTAKQPPDLMQQATNFGQIMDVVDSLRGAGGRGEEDDGLGGHPMARSLFKIADKVASNIPAIADAFSASRGGGAQAPAPQQQAYMPQPGPMMHYPAPMPPASTAMVPAAAPAGAPRVKLKKADLQLAIGFIDGVLAQPQPPAPEDVARTALGVVDHSVLRELARRDPGKVLQQLAQAGLLVGNTAEPTGQQYVVQVLAALKGLV